MQGVVRAAADLAVDRDEFLDLAHLAGDHDPIAPEPERLGLTCASKGRLHERLAGHFGGAFRLFGLRVLVHQPGREALIEAPPVDPDPDRPPVLDSRLDHGCEALVALLAEAHVAGVDAVFGEGPGALRVALQQPVAVVVEVADEGNAASGPVKRAPYLGNRLRRIGVVDGHPDQLRARLGEGPDLGDGRRHVGGVRIRHGLDHDRGSSADDHISDPDADRPAARFSGLLHGASSVRSPDCSSGGGIRTTARLARPGG